MKRGLTVTFFITILLASIVFPLIKISPAKASGFGTFTFQDRATITLTGLTVAPGISGSVTFVDQDIYDTNYNYAPQGGGICQPPGGSVGYGINLKGSPPNWGGRILATINIGYKSASNCVPIDYTASGVQIQNPKDTNTKLPSAETTNTWSGSNIVSLPGVTTTPEGAESYQPVAGSANLYTAQTNDGECDTLGAVVLNSGKIQGKLYAIEGSGGSGSSVSNYPQINGSYNNSTGGGCLVPQVWSIVVGGTPPGAGGGGGGGGGGASGPNITCDIGIDTSSFGSFLGSINPLNWLLCGIIKGMSSIVISLDGEINSWLVIGTSGNTSTDDPNSIFSNNGHCAQQYNKTTGGTGSACDAYETAWSKFRDLSLGLLAIVTLFIIIAQALGTEYLDPYTIRKMLPRVVAGAIIITVSWPLMRFMVTLSNDLGYGVGRLLSGPFSGIADNVSTNGVNGLLAEFAISIGALAFGFFGLLSFLATAALAVFVAFLVLVIRQIAVIMLIIFAPIAIISYALPNTQRVFRFWWDSFFKLLLMFPMIVAMITIGHIFSAIASQPPAGQKTAGFINTVIAVIAYFAPYFMIPLTFRFAGGVMSTVGNAVNSRAEGTRGALSKFRANQASKRMQERAQKFKTGEFESIVPARFKRLNRLNRAATGALNEFGKRSTSGIRGGFGFGARGESAREGSLDEAAELAGKDPAMHKNANINAFNRLMVLTAKHNGDEAAAKEELRTWYSSDRNEYNKAFEGEELEEKINDASGRMRNVGGYTPGRAAAAYLAMGADGTAIRDVRDSGEIAAWISQGSSTTAYNMLSNVASVSKRSGRSELSPSQENKAALVSATVKAHSGVVVDNFDEIIDRATMSGAGSETGLNVLSGGPARVIRGNVEHSMDIIQRHAADPTSVTFEDAAQAASVVLDLKNNVDMGYGKTDNKIAFAKAMDAEGRKEALEAFLNTDTNDIKTVQVEGPEVSPGRVPTAQVHVKSREYVNGLVGARYSQVPIDQQQRMATMAQDQQPDQPDQQP